MKIFASIIFLVSSASILSSSTGLPKFRKVEIDSKLEIGYGLALADVNGDGKTDIVLADKKQFVWYRNPTWQKFILAENLTERDNVCIAARDIDGDGKAEIAVGGQWNPGETSDETASGSVHYLLPPEDRTKLWTPVKLQHEPTVHRMMWMKSPGGKFDLVVLPLHGRGNINGEGAGVRTLAYEMPKNPREPWTTKVIDTSMHKSHNLDIVENFYKESSEEHVLIAGEEGVRFFKQTGEGYEPKQIIGTNEGSIYKGSDFKGAGEVRHGEISGGARFAVTVEPMHGNQLVAYFPPREDVNNGEPGLRKVLFNDMVEGHALACDDLLGVGYDQVVVGWRGDRNNPKAIGVRLFIPGAKIEDDWSQMDIDYDGMACEDLKVGDLDGDGRPDIVACGRSTKNLRIYFNEAPQ